MKQILFAAMLAGMFVSRVPSAYSQNNQIQNYDGVAIVPSSYGDLICLGNWNGDAGRCEGAAVSSGALAAISASKSADKLEQIRLLLETMNKGLSANTQALLNMQKSPILQSLPAKDSLSEAIMTRFDAIPPGILAVDSVKQEIEKLKEDILQELDRRNFKPANAQAK
jgi:hypothetical protein